MFVSVKFHERDARTYTYTCDFPVAHGDRVTVATKNGQKIVNVWAVDVEEPAFACKSITGFAPKPENAADE